jgi:hypothetical protein
MKTHRIPAVLLLAAVAAFASARALRADEATSHIAFSDPTKPGTLKIRVWRGEVTIHGSDAKDISVRSESEATGPTPRKDGMRVLSASASYALTENANVVLLEYGADGFSGGSADFDITVPKSTNVIVANSTRGDFSCEGVDGDIEVRSMSGDVKLDQVSGGALVETMSGDIKVTVKALAPSKPLSFTSMRGEVTIRVPADTKAAIHFRTHRGVILTNFDDKALVTRTEISHRAPKVRNDKAKQAPGASGTASPDVAPSSDAPKAESGDDWRGEVRDSVREAVEDAVEAAHDAAQAAQEGLAEAHYAAGGYGVVAPFPPLPPLPPMTGGKTVSGTLNGGGVEIQAATLNGDIVLKKIE